jgi:hypothetical protein
LLDGDVTAATLVDGLGRDVYIDFVADTGDDVSVSRAVARLVFASYELPDPDRPGQFLNAPRGEILFFGGDTAYPVATAKEILNRVIVPWNQVLAERPDDGRRRVLLGIPGNHDWYDGSDGFARMFRRREHATAPPAPLVGESSSHLKYSAEWVREFARGGTIDKPDALVLAGYTPVQSASHFVLRLASRIDLLAVDRQLTVIDPRQRAFGEPSKTGTKMIETLRLDATARKTFVLSGDIHHYERAHVGESLHVTAGGGGAFLLPTRVAKGGLTPTVSWPSVAQTRQLLRGVPWKLARGRSGLIPHLCLLLLYAPPIFFGEWFLARLSVRAWAVAGTTIALGTVAALIPFGASRLVAAARPHVPDGAWLPVAAGALIVATFLGTLLFGGLLALFTLRGYEHIQAMAALDHPGFKHFVRLRVRADGSGIDGWCIGAADPLRAGARPELVDKFVWRPFEGGREVH